MSDEKICIKDKLAIIIITKNHKEIMEEWMRIFPKQNTKANVEVWVYDSSDNDDTQKICEENSEFVHYFRFDPDIGDEKAVDALTSIDREYLWLCGDGVIPNMDLVYDLLVEEFSKKTDVIHFFGKNQANIAYKKKIGMGDEIVYTDDEKREFFRDFWWSLAWLGVTIVNKRVIDNVDFDEMLEKYGQKGFIFPTAVCCSLQSLSNIRCLVIHHNCFTANRKKIASGWKQEGQVIPIWSKNTVLTIDAMPEYFEKYKHHVMENCWLNNNFLTTRGLLDWRSNNFYNIQDYKLYKQYLTITSQKNCFTLYCIARLPKKFCKWLLHLKK